FSYISFFVFFHPPATSELYTLSLHDALPIWVYPFYTRTIGLDQNRAAVPIVAGARLLGKEDDRTLGVMSLQTAATATQASTNYRSEEHTSELQSRENLVCRLLLEKKKKKNTK